MRGLAVAQAELTSFDRQFHARCALQRPDRYRLLDALPVDAPRIAHWRELDDELDALDAAAEARRKVVKQQDRARAAARAQERR